MRDESETRDAPEKPRRNTDTSAARLARRRKYARRELDHALMVVQVAGYIVRPSADEEWSTPETYPYLDLVYKYLKGE